MAELTVALEPDAYERLELARRSDAESFSDVVRRAVWPSESSPAKGGEILAFLRSRQEFLHDAALDAIEHADQRVNGLTVLSF